LDFTQDGLTPVFKDNTACIEWRNNVIGCRERAKDIDIRKHFAHEAIKNGDLILKKVPTILQLADIMRQRLTPTFCCPSYNAAKLCEQPVWHFISSYIFL